MDCFSFYWVFRALIWIYTVAVEALIRLLTLCPVFLFTRQLIILSTLRNGTNYCNSWHICYFIISVSSVILVIILKMIKINRHYDKDSRPYNEDHVGLSATKVFLSMLLKKTQSDNCKSFMLCDYMYVYVFVDCLCVHIYEWSKSLLFHCAF